MAKKVVREPKINEKEKLTKAVAAMAKVIKPQV